MTNPVFPEVPAFPNDIKYQHDLLNEILWEMLMNCKNELVFMRLGYRFTELSIEHVLLENKYMSNIGYPFIDLHNKEHIGLIDRDCKILNKDIVTHDDINDILNRWSYHMFLYDKPMEEWAVRNRKRF